MSLDEVSSLFSCASTFLKIYFSSLQKFNKAAEDIKALKATPTTDEFKEIYALFKQATVGDVNVG